jgi:small subunit ribosomal protein S6
LILHPDISEEDTNTILEQITETVTKHGAPIVKTDKWGKKSLKYQIKKFSKAQYIFVYFNGNPAVLSDIDRLVRYNEHILRYNFIRLAAPPALTSTETAESPKETQAGSDSEQTETPVAETKAHGESAESTEESAAPPSE